MSDTIMKTSLLAVGFALAVACAGCSAKVNLEKVPVGTRIEVTRQDGGVVSGALAALDDQNVRITVGSATRVIPRGQIVDVRLENQG